MAPTDIVDWSDDCPQWPAILTAVQGVGVTNVHSPLWPIYGSIVQGGRGSTPFVIGQLGQSLDGRIATTTGHSHYINGPPALVHLHRLRAVVDAVVVGVGTALADDPQLTVRRVAGPNPTRVIIDPQGRMPLSARCFAADGARRIVISGKPVPTAPGAENVVLTAEPAGILPAQIVAALAGLGFKRILIEGGANTLSRFLKDGALDRLHVMTAPLIIGSGPVGITLPPIAKLDMALRPVTTSYQLPGGEVLFDCDLRTKANA